MNCPRCGLEVPDNAEICYKCGNKLSVPAEQSYLERKFLEDSYDKKSEAAAVILSLLAPGLGEIYLCKETRGFVILAVAMLCVILGIQYGFPYIAYLALCVLSAYDSSKLARIYNKYVSEHNGEKPWN